MNKVKFGSVLVRSFKSILKVFGLRVMFSKNSLILSNYIKNLEMNYAKVKVEHRNYEIIDRKNHDYKKYFAKSHSQFSQDIFALTFNDWKRDGFFVEFGAYDGKTHSNTYMLEKEFGWRGIIAECSKGCEEILKRNRTCDIEFRALWKESDRDLEFLDCDQSELSTLTSYRESDGHAAIRQKGEVYSVKTITLDSLLKKYNAPKRIDYMSIDTEGSEWDILEGFPFVNYEIGVITIEHNFNSNRNHVSSLLLENGFNQIFQDISEIEDWFVKGE